MFFSKWSPQRNFGLKLSTRSSSRIRQASYLNFDYLILSKIWICHKWICHKVNTVLTMEQVCNRFSLTILRYLYFDIGMSEVLTQDHGPDQCRARKWIGKWLYNLWFQKNIYKSHLWAATLDISFTMWSSNNELDTLTTKNFTFSRDSHFKNIYLNQDFF